MTNRVLMSIALATVLSAGSLYADKPEHAGKGKKEKKHKKQKHNKKLSSKDTDRIHNYYKGLPPGLQKKMRRGGQLPPGWQKKVNVGQALPYEYLMYARPVPYELSSQLTAGPIGTKLLQLVDRVVRVEVGTNMVLEAIQF
jgi:hypothetical protein